MQTNTGILKGNIYFDSSNQFFIWVFSFNSVKGLEALPPEEREHEKGYYGPRVLISSYEADPGKDLCLSEAR
ncbi:MAG: hypothetical protein Ct9H300mP15_19360 [Gemmatimonadota bacterium]|nr:MAG: hypothetical protein Ct9H300mP15_19360 [Gemmatimonadota bacterium]